MFPWLRHRQIVVGVDGEEAMPWWFCCDNPYHMRFVVMATISYFFRGFLKEDYYAQRGIAEL